MHDYVWLAHVDGQAAGLAEARLPFLDNVDNAEVDIQVHPDLRRGGLGRRLLEHAAAHCRAEGRSRVIGSSVESLPGGPPRDAAGSAFAAAMGARPAHREVRRRLHVTRAKLENLAYAREGRRRSNRWTHRMRGEHAYDRDQ